MRTQDKMKAGSKSTSKAHVYSLNLQGGKKYVGYTTNLNQRLNQHFGGHGAKWTQAHKPISVNHVQQCRSVQNAKKAETIVYFNMKKYHGTSKVRGAGHTKSK